MIRTIAAALAAFCLVSFSAFAQGSTSTDTSTAPKAETKSDTKSAKKHKKTKKAKKSASDTTAKDSSAPAPK